MIGLDTNILVRYLAQDEPEQSRIANTLLESLSSEVPGFVSLVVMTEVVWVLLGPYKATKEQVLVTIRQVIQTSVIVVERAEIVWQALRSYEKTSADFSDCLIARLAVSAGCLRTYTFDRKAAKLAGMHLLH